MERSSFVGERNREDAIFATGCFSFPGGVLVPFVLGDSADLGVTLPDPTLLCPEMKTILNFLYARENMQGTFTASQSSTYTTSDREHKSRKNLNMVDKPVHKNRIEGPQQGLSSY